MSTEEDIGYLKGQLDTMSVNYVNLDKKLDDRLETMEQRHQDAMHKYAKINEERFKTHHDKYTESHNLYNNVLNKVNAHEQKSAIHHEKTNGKMEIIEVKVQNIESTMTGGFHSTTTAIEENKKNIQKLLLIGGSILAGLNAILEYLPQIIGLQ